MRKRKRKRKRTPLFALLTCAHEVHGLATVRGSAPEVHVNDLLGHGPAAIRGERPRGPRRRPVRPRTRRRPRGAPWRPATTTNAAMASTASRGSALEVHVDGLRGHGHDVEPGEQPQGPRRRSERPATPPLEEAPRRCTPTTYAATASTPTRECVPRGPRRRPTRPRPPRRPVRPPGRSTSTTYAVPTRPRPPRCLSRRRLSRDTQSMWRGALGAIVAVVPCRDPRRRRLSKDTALASSQSTRRGVRGRAL